MIFVKYLLLLSLIGIYISINYMVTITRPDNQESFTMNRTPLSRLNSTNCLSSDADPPNSNLKQLEKELRFSHRPPVSQKVFDTNKV